MAKATVFNPKTKERKVVTVGDPNAFAGGFLLELSRKGLYEIFPRDILDVYLTPVELVERIRYWLEHSEEREVIAEKGYNWVHTNATYTHRIEQALGYMGNIENNSGNKR